MSNADGSGESLNLPTIDNVPIPESSDSVADKNTTKISATNTSSTEFESSLKKLVSKELRDLTKSLPGGNLGDFKLLDESGGEITQTSGMKGGQTNKKLHKKRNLSLSKKDNKTGEGKSKKPRKARIPGLARKTWDERAACVFVYLHPKLGNKDYQLTGEICKVSSNTLRGWLSKVSLMVKWVCFLDTMTAEEAGKILSLDMEKYKVGLSETVDSFCFHETLAKKNATPVRVQKGKKRIQKSPRVSKWHPQFLFVKNILDELWANGKPISLKSIRDAVVVEFKNPVLKLIDPVVEFPAMPIPKALKTLAEEKAKPVIETADVQQRKAELMNQFAKKYLGTAGKNYPTLINTFVLRAISRAGYTLRDRCLKKTNSNDWKERFYSFSNDFLMWFKKNNFDSVVLLDSIFMIVNQQDEFFRADITPDIDLSSGSVAITAATLPVVELFEPLVIVAEQEFEEAESNADSNSADPLTYHVTKDGLVDQEALKRVLQRISEKLSGKRVALLVDTASMFSTPEFLETLNDINNSGSATFSTYSIIDSIGSVVNVVENDIQELLKETLKRDYESDRTSVENQQLDYHKKIEIISAAFKTVNELHTEKVENFFTRCGINPFVESTVTKTLINEHVERVTEFESNLVKVNKVVIDPNKSPPVALELNLP